MFNPQFPIFIPSYSRHDTRYTSKYLDYMKVPYRMVVQPEQYKDYLREVKDPKKLIFLICPIKRNTIIAIIMVWISRREADQHAILYGISQLAKAMNITGLWMTISGHFGASIAIIESKSATGQYLKQWKISH